MNASKNFLFITFMLTATIASAQSKKEIPPLPPKITTPPPPPPHAPKALVPEISGPIHLVKPSNKMVGKLPPPPPPPPLPPVPPPPPPLPPKAA